MVEIGHLFPGIKQYCGDYITDEQPDFAVKISYADIVFEREKSAHEDKVEGRTVRQFSEEYLEILAVYRKIADRMPEYNTILFHGSVIAVDGIGYLFTARSGTGKSTHTRLWREKYGSRAVMVNDDKPLLKVTNFGVTVYGTPWDGKHRLSSNIGVELEGLCLLTRSKVNYIEPISQRSAWPLLMQQTYRPENRYMMKKTLELVDRLTQNVRLWKMGCNMTLEAARVAYETMKKREDKT